MSDRGRRSDSEKEGPTSSEVAANKKVPVSRVDMLGFVLGCVGFFLLNFAVNSTNCPVRVGHYDTELNYPDRRYWYFAVTRAERMTLGDGGTICLYRQNSEGQILAESTPICNQVLQY